MLACDTGEQYQCLYYIVNMNMTLQEFEQEAKNTMSIDKCMRILSVSSILMRLSTSVIGTMLHCMLEA